MLRQLIKHLWRRGGAVLALVLALSSVIMNNPFLKVEVQGQATDKVSLSPSKDWGIFFDTEGDLEFIISQPGVAVKIEAPRGFLEGRAENDTSFLESDFSYDYFYYNLVDGALHHPYDPNSPYIVEIWYPRALRLGLPPPPGLNLNFTPPKHVWMRKLRAPSVAGIYNFSVYVAQNFTRDDGKRPAHQFCNLTRPFKTSEYSPNYPKNPTKILSLLVSMREDPASISGRIYEEVIVSGVPTKRYISTTGIVYATKLDEPFKNGMARAFVDTTNGFYNLTGLYAGKYLLQASAGYLPQAGYAFVLTDHMNYTVTKGAKLAGVDIKLQRGVVIYGNLTYSLPPAGRPIRSIDHPGIRAIKFPGGTTLNYTVEAYDSRNRLVATYFSVTKNGTKDAFKLVVRNDTRYVGYPPLGTRYSGFRPALGPPETYRLRAYMFGYVQKQDILVSISSSTESVNATIELVTGGVINGTLRFNNPEGKPETPRQSEVATLGTSTGRFYGGNILISAYNQATLILKGVMIINGTDPAGLVTYADSTIVKFYAAGFSEYYNKTYSGVWRKRDYGFETGTYIVKVWVRGYLQASSLVTIAEGGNSTLYIDMIRGGAVTVTVHSMIAWAGTKRPQAEVTWQFLGEALPPYVRVYLLLAGIRVGHMDALIALGPTVTPTTATLTFTGHDWPIRHIAYFGYVPTALTTENYGLEAHAYGYLQARPTYVLVTQGEASRASIYLLVACGIEGGIILRRDEFSFIQLTENVSVRMEARDRIGLLKGAETFNATIGASAFMMSLYGLRGYGHYFYVDTAGRRYDDVGLDTGNYTVTIPEFGRDWRFMQIRTIFAFPQNLGDRVTVIYSLYRLGKIYGVVRGLDYWGGNVTLSWASVSAGARWTPTLDGNYTLHLPNGTYTVTYSLPGYQTLSRPFTISWSSAQGYNVLLWQQASPSPKFSLLMLDSQANEVEIHMAIAATKRSYSSLNGSYDLRSLESESGA